MIRYVYPDGFEFSADEEFINPEECPNGCRHIYVPPKYRWDRRQTLLRSVVPKKARSRTALTWNAALAHLLSEFILGESHGVFPILSLDFESYEHDHSRLLELGLYSAQWHCGGYQLKPNPLLGSRHYVFMENEHLRNRDYVQDARDHFVFGETTFAKAPKIRKRFREQLDNAGFVFVFNASAEIDYAATLGVDLTQYPLIDVEMLCRFLNGKSSSLRNACIDHLYKDSQFKDLPPGVWNRPEVLSRSIPLHNAGNDAVLTALLGMSLTLKHLSSEKLLTLE
jgi:hypothetical protein